MTAISVIGGGTGSYVVLSGLKNYPHRLNAIVSMADSGGSAKKERDEWGLLPVSDVRKALLALAQSKNSEEKALRKLINYRFSEGIGLQGMTFGNLLLVALTDILNSQEAAIIKAGQLLNCAGNVIPVSFTKTNLILEYQDGKVIVGEHLLDNFHERFPDQSSIIDNIYLLPPAEPNPRAVQAIEESSLLVLPPGDLYGSILANLAVKEITTAIKKSSAPLVCIMNLVTKYGQTHSFKASNHIREIEQHAQRKVDYIIINSTPLPKKVLVQYAREKDFPVHDDLRDDPRVIRGDFLSEERPAPQKGDQLKRSLIRHHPAKLARVIDQLASSLPPST